MGKGGKIDEDYYDDLEAVLLKEDYFLSKSGGMFNQHDFDHKINLSSRIENDITRSEKKGEKRTTHHGKDERATNEQVLDPRTRLILFKLLANGFLEEIDGCLSTGKEANVYYGHGPLDKNDNIKEYAIKIFKTSILVFKDRDKYVSGDFRLRNGYCRSNPRKLVQVWAEKEMRNLKRLHSIGLSVPYPYFLKKNVLILEFIGKDGWCSKRIKDVRLDHHQWFQSYRNLVVSMRRMYQDGNLVHGDLSEYNLLWYENPEGFRSKEENDDEDYGGEIRIIDVSQSVEQSHPLASEFLRKDVANVTDFFTKRGIRTFSKLKLFKFVTDLTLPKMTININEEDDEKKKYIQKYEKKLKQLFDKWMEDDYDEDELQYEKMEEERRQEDEKEEIQNLKLLKEKEKIIKKLEKNTDTASSITKEEEEKEYNELLKQNDLKYLEKLRQRQKEDELVLDKIRRKKEEIEKEEEIEEAIFMQSYIPTSLAEISNPYAEMQRLLEGKREKAYTEAIQRMMGIDDEDKTKEESDSDIDEYDVVAMMKNKINKKKAEEDNESSDSQDSDSGSESESDSDSDENSDEDEVDKKKLPKKKSDKYRRTLPSRDNLDERSKEKEARKELKKQQKEDKAEKRKNKIKKHVKKRAMKLSKK